MKIMVKFFYCSQFSSHLMPYTNSQHKISQSFTPKTKKHVRKPRRMIDDFADAISDLSTSNCYYQKVKENCKFEASLQPLFSGKSIWFWDWAQSCLQTHRQTAAFTSQRENCFNLRYFALLLYIRYLCSDRRLLCFIFFSFFSYPENIEEFLLFWVKLEIIRCTEAKHFSRLYLRAPDEKSNGNWSEI